MRKRICLLGVLLVVGLTGCGAGSDAINEFENIKAESEKKESGGQAEVSEVDENGIPKHIKGVLNEGGTRSLSLDADVEAKGYDEAKIYTMKTITMNEERMVSLAERIFDGGKYTSQLPYKYWDKAELTKEKNHFNELAEMPEYKAKGYEVDWHVMFNLDVALSQEKPQKMPTLADGATMFYEDVPSLPNHYGKYVKDQFCNLRGTINGKEYLLSYKEIVGGEFKNMYGIQLYPLFPIASKDWLFDSEATPSDPVNLEGMKNAGDEEALQKDAEALLKKLGCEDFILATSRNKEVYDASIQGTCLNGYEFTYVRDFPEMSKDTTLSSHALVRYDEDNNENGTPLENVQIHMTPEGLESFSMHVYYDRGEPLAEDVSLLSLDQVNESVEEMMKHVNPQSADEKLYQSVLFDEDSPVTRIRLSYMPAEYEGQCVYMPMWCYCFNMSDPWECSGETQLPVITISAVDGNTYFYKVFTDPIEESEGSAILEEE